MGDELAERIGRHLSRGPSDRDEVLGGHRAIARPHVEGVFQGIEDADWVAPIVDVELRNAIAWSLDHVSSRLDATGFVRALGGVSSFLDEPGGRAPRAR